MDYGEADSSFAPCVTGDRAVTLTVYEMDLGLNHVTRKYLVTVDASSRLLIPVAGEPEGPGGVFVVQADRVVYKKKDHEERECRLPRRYFQAPGDVSAAEDPGTFVTCWAKLQSNDLLFYLLMTEQGDLLRLSLDWRGGQVLSVSISYFDTVQPANQISILPSGYLFVAGETSNHVLFQFTSSGEDQHALATSASTLVPLYNPREQHLNLKAEDELHNLACVSDLKCEDLLGEGQPQLYLTCGRGAYSTLRVLRPGLQTLELVKTPWPQDPKRVLTFKCKFTDTYI